MESAPAVLVVRNCSSSAMRPVAQALAAHFDAERVRRVETVQEAALAVGAGWQADLCVVCQHWPDEFTAGEGLRLLALCPLARIVCVYGPWCASDGRRRDVWPLAVRVPVDRAAERIRAEIEVLRGIRQPLPLTASRDEIFAFDTSV